MTLDLKRVLVFVAGLAAVMLGIIVLISGPSNPGPALSSIWEAVHLAGGGSISAGAGLLILAFL